uniref:Uncharacterized protein n=1 Tax=Arundo donax TaxID=35708 RepID=A0A0A9H6D6_ARUDO
MPHPLANVMRLLCENMIKIINLPPYHIVVHETESASLHKD